MKIVLLVLLAASTSLAAQSQAPPSGSQAKVDYERDVRPLLAENCYSCHGANAQQAGLRLDLRQNALRGGDYGPVIIPGKSADSKLIKRLINGDGGMQMPPSGPLQSEQIATLKAWIDQGAEFKTDVTERPAPPIDPQLAALIETVRSQPRARVEQAVAANPQLLNAADASGSTLLHHAAGFGTLDTVTLLLDKGAAVNAKNRLRSTALHWAMPDEQKMRLLLDRGADVNARQIEGRTPLLLASMMARASAAMRLLLERGADPTIATANGQTPLMAAALRGDVEAMQLLLAKKVDVNTKNGAGETALMLAATDGNPQAVKLLLDHGADAKVRSKRNETALGNAGTSGQEATVKLLLDSGAEVNVRNIRGFSPLMLAASSDTIPEGVVKRLLASGADTSFTGDYDENARDLAAKRGDTAVTRLLGGITAQPVIGPAASHTSPRRTIPDAVSTALALLEKQSHTFIRTAGCDSCHSQDLPSAAAAFARSRNVKAPAEIPQLPSSMTIPAERVMDFGFVAVSGIAWELFDRGMSGQPANAFTDATVRAIMATQTAVGSWSNNESRRPPMNAGDYQATALAIYAITRYAPANLRAAADDAIARAVEWLKTARPGATQDHAFRVLGLAWSKIAPADARAAARPLIELQRGDGSWSQLPTMQSDAYATGQALYALFASNAVAREDAVYQKGVDYLLRTQAADGSWHVKSRSIWLQPYFESGFPYGQDQFISAAGTAWAAMALTAAAPSQTTTVR